MAITNPDANTIRLTNESAADFDDIVSAGVSGITKTGNNTFVITRDLQLVNSTLSDTNKVIKFEWGSRSLPLSVDTNSELQLGELDGDGYGINGCSVYMYHTNTATASLGSSLGSAGNLKLYGCALQGESVNGGNFFWRFYSSISSQVVDIRDCYFHNFFGGGRFQGANSKVVRCRYVNCIAFSAPFTTKSPFGEISGNRVFAGSNSYYWFPQESGSLAVSNAFGRDNDTAAYIADSSGSTATLTFIDADFDVWAFSWNGVNNTGVRVREDYNYVPTVLDQATQTAITSGRIYIENLAGTQVHNEALDGSGQVGELILRAGQYRSATGNTRTDETPHTVKVRCYGYQFQEFPVDIDARTVTNLSQNENNFVVANEATAGAYTGITVNGSAETITVSSNHSLQEVYDYCNWWAAQSANMQYDMPISTADGINFALLSSWTFTVSNGVTLSGVDQNLSLPSGSVIDGPVTCNIVLAGTTAQADDIENFGGSLNLTGAAVLTIDGGAGGDFPAGASGASAKFLISESGDNTYDATAYDFDASTDIEITSGDDITVTLSGGQTEPNAVETSGTITFDTPVLTQGLTINGLVAGSTVRIFEAGTQTEIDSTTSSGTSFSWSETWTADRDVDYTVLQDGYVPIRVTDVALGAAISTQSVSQEIDRAFITPSGLTFGSTATVNTGTSRFGLTTASSTQNWYSFMVQSWRTQAALRNVTFPLAANGSLSYSLNDGWEFDNSTSIGNLSLGGLRYFDGGVAAYYAALQTPTQSAGTKVWALQEDGGSWSLLNTGTGFSGLIQTFGDATHGNFDYTDFLVLKATGDGYTLDEWDLINDGGLSEIVDSFYFAPLVISLTGETPGDPGVSVTVTNIPDETWNGITVGVEIDTGVGVSGSDILRHITWQRHQGNLLDFGQLVLPLGGDYQSVRGRVFDGTPLEIEGTKVLQNGSIHPDFTLFEGEPGETYTPPVQVTGQVDLTQAGSRIQVFNVTTDTEIANEIVAGTTWSLSQLSGSSTYWDVGDSIRIRATYQNGLDATSKATTTTTVGGSENWSVTLSQTTCPVYDAYGIDGSTITEFAWDGANVEFDVNDPDNEWYVARLFAWDKYYTFTETGIREAFEYISALDAGNIQIDNAAALDNLKAATAIQGDQIRLFRPNGTLPVVNPTTGGGGFTFYSTGTIYTITSGSGVTPQDKTDIINGVWSYLIETGYTAVETQRIIAAALAGKLSGANGTTITIRDILDNKDRIVATVDADGNRTAITLDGT